MKKKTLLAILTFAFCFVYLTANYAQFDIINNAKSKVQSRVNQSVNKKIDDALDGKSKQQTAQTDKQQSTDTKAPKTAMQAYARYDFTPGKDVIFEDDFHGEKSDEIPAKWIVQSGKIETAKIEGQVVVSCSSSGSMIPRISTKRYLSERFTIEYDYLFYNYKNSDYHDKYTGQMVSFCAEGNCNGLGEFVDVDGYNMGGSGCIKIWYSGETHYRTYKGKPLSFEHGVWRHVAIAVTEKSVKVYLDDERVVNAPILSRAQANSFRLSAWAEANTIQTFFRNFRIASGGSEPYQQIETDGKFIARGINFDYGKATLRPESMGEMNRIVDMMKEHSDLRFEIGGHTDSDGDESVNQKLSEKRADAVRQQLITLGIDKERFTTKGYGKSKPIADNTQPEGKANNRRVEFVKQ